MISRNYWPLRGVQWPWDKHVVSLGGPQSAVAGLMIIITIVIIGISFTKTEQTIPQWKKLKSFSWSHAIFANPRISLHRNKHHTLFLLGFIGIPYHLAPTNGINLVFLSCQVTLIAWFGLHHCQYLKGPFPTPGSPTIRDRDVSINKKILNMWMRFPFLGKEVLEVTWKYIKILETTRNFWYFSPNLFSKPPSRGSRFHHSQLLSRVVPVSKRVVWNQIHRILWNLPIPKNN